MRHFSGLALALCAIAVTSAPCLAADGKLGVFLVERSGRVVIQNVEPGSGADAIGIQPGDVLVKVGTTDVSSIQDALNAKALAQNNVDVPFLLETPGGLWAINARFERGQPYGKYTAAQRRPGGAASKPALPRPGGNPPRP